MVKTIELPVLTVDPNVHTGAFLTGLTIQDNAFKFHQSKTVDSFWPVNVLTTRKVWQCSTCTRYTLASTCCTSTCWLILTLTVTGGLRSIPGNRLTNIPINRIYLPLDAGMLILCLPSVVLTATRLLLRSATAMSPLGHVVIPLAHLKSPSAVPSFPKDPTMSHSPLLTTWPRSTLSAASLARPVNLRNDSFWCTCKEVKQGRLRSRPKLSTFSR